MKPLNDSIVDLSFEEKLQYANYILGKLLPFLEKIQAEQMIEKEMESKIKGIFLSFWWLRAQWMFVQTQIQTFCLIRDSYFRDKATTNKDRRR